MSKKYVGFVLFLLMVPSSLFCFENVTARLSREIVYRNGTASGDKKVIDCEITRGAEDAADISEAIKNARAANRSHLDVNSEPTIEGASSVNYYAHEGDSKFPILTILYQSSAPVLGTFKEGTSELIDLINRECGTLK